MVMIKTIPRRSNRRDRRLATQGKACILREELRGSRSSFGSTSARVRVESQTLSRGHQKDEKSHPEHQISSLAIHTIPGQTIWLQAKASDPDRITTLDRLYYQPISVKG
jgi:hypothetical protein